MGYDIFIGNAELVVYKDEDGKPESYTIEVERMTHPDASTFENDMMTGNGNSRHPGYHVWSQFCEETRLYDLFFNSIDGLMMNHPGQAVLREEHALEIEQALTLWKEKHPDATPRFGKDVADADTNLARLIWLDWWVKYALANCERPCISNS